MLPATAPASSPALAEGRQGCDEGGAGSAAVRSRKDPVPPPMLEAMTRYVPVSGKRTRIRLSHPPAPSSSRSPSSSPGPRTLR